MNAVKAKSINNIDSGMGALDVFTDRADLEIVVEGTSLSSFWAVQIYVTDLNDGRSVVELVALGHGAARQMLIGTFAVASNMGTVRSYSFSNSKKKRTKIIEMLEGQILPDNESDAEKIIYGNQQTSSPSIPQSEHQDQLQTQSNIPPGWNDVSHSGDMQPNQHVSNSKSVQQSSAPVGPKFNSDGSVNITGINDADLISMGKTFQKNREYKHSQECFEPLARKRNTEGQYNLGIAIWESALAAAQSGSADKAKKAFNKALTWIKPVADGGNAESQVKMGEAYMFGRGVDKDITKAKEYYQKAADKGHTHAKKIIVKL
jgi:tetratricopeptide (TPR) repeat protein